MSEDIPDYKRLLASGVVSEPYANQIVNGRRKPSVTMALAIYAATGLKFGRLSGLDQGEIAALRRAFGGSA